MSDKNLLEIGAALADLAALAEKNAAAQPVLMQMLSSQVETLRTLVSQERLVPVVNVAPATPNVSVQAAPAPVVNVNAQAGETIVHVLEAKSKKVRLTVNRNASGFIESLDVETITE